MALFSRLRNRHGLLSIASLSTLARKSPEQKFSVATCVASLLKLILVSTVLAGTDVQAQRSGGGGSAAGLMVLVIGILLALFIVGKLIGFIRRRFRNNSSAGNAPQKRPSGHRSAEPDSPDGPRHKDFEPPVFAGGQPNVGSARGIFLSYRRDDAEGQAGRLYNDLAQAFGAASVFIDVAGIDPGLDFRKVIDKHVASCSVLLTLIGPQWLDAKDQAGNRRLDSSIDFVRLETAAALRRDIPVIPILVRGARMPQPDQLPDDLKDLAYRNGAELTHARWDSDVEVLIQKLRRLVTA